MNKKQKILYLCVLSTYILLMIWCFIEKDYLTIIKSFSILIGSFIMGVIFAKLGDSDVDV